MKKFKQELKVRSYELDSQGHVNYGVYLNYLEYARVLTMEQLGIPFQEYIKKKKFIVIAEVNIKYLAPAYMGDELEITLEGIKTGRASFSFRQEIIRKKDGRRIVDAILTGVFVNEEGKPVHIDEDFKKMLFD